MFSKTIEGFPVWGQNAFKLHHHAVEQAVGEPCFFFFFFLSISASFACEDLVSSLFCFWSTAFQRARNQGFIRVILLQLISHKDLNLSVCSAKWKCQSTSDINVQKSHNNLWNHIETKGVLAKQLVFPHLGKLKTYRLKSFFFSQLEYFVDQSVYFGEKRGSNNWNVHQFHQN